MKYYRISALTFCLSVYSTLAMAQNVTIHKQNGVGHVYKVEKVDSVVYFPIGDAEQFPASEAENTTTLWNIIEGPTTTAPPIISREMTPHTLWLFGPGYPMKPVVKARNTSVAETST